MCSIKFSMWFIMEKFYSHTTYRYCKPKLQWSLKRSFCAYWLFGVSTHTLPCLCSICFFHSPLFSSALNMKLYLTVDYSYFYSSSCKHKQWSKSRTKAWAKATQREVICHICLGFSKNLSSYTCICFYMYLLPGIENLVGIGLVSLMQ